MAGQSDPVDGDLHSDGSDSSSDQEEFHGDTYGSATCSVISFESFATGTLSFEIVYTRLAGKLKRYVVYAVRVRHSKESTECDATTVERRYSDFERLHGCLTALHPAVMTGLVFPKKLWAGNFSTENIARRCQMFEQYLMHLCELPPIVCSRPFHEFFYAPELQRQLASLMVIPLPPPEEGRVDGAGVVNRAPGSVPLPAEASSTVRGLRSCLLMQLKLRCFVGSEKALLCAAGLVVAHLDAGDAAAAHAYAMQLLAALSLPDRMPRDARRQLFGPLADLASELSLTLSAGSGDVLVSVSAQADGRAVARDPSVAAAAAAASVNEIGLRPSDGAGLAVLHQTLRNALRLASAAADSWAP